MTGINRRIDERERVTFYKKPIILSTLEKLHIPASPMKEGMQPGLDENDWERIRRFAKTSLYDRDPDMLVPESEDEERD